METVERNAKESLAQHKLSRASDLTTRSKALEEIADALDLDQAPLRIECYDVSHIQGNDVVASMVVFEDGLARKSEYRRFAVQGHGGRRRLDLRGDLAPVPALPGGALAPTRRARRPSDDADGPDGPIDPETGRPRKFAYPPNLVVVDGGAARRRPPPSGRSTSWASTTSRCAGWPSGWRRSGCPARISR